MQDLPHHYTVAAAAEAESTVTLSSSGLPDLATAGPPEFGGPGDLWSPEALLVGAIADCFILSFRAIARAAKLDWDSLRCEVTGTLDKIERVTQFTGYDISAELTIRAAGNAAKAERLLEKAEHHCLITNSLKAEPQLKTRVLVSD